MPQSGGFRVDLEVLQSKAQYTQNLVPQIQSQLQQLNGEMESLFGTWKGQASSSFQCLRSQLNQLSSTWDGASKEAYLGVQQDWNRVSTSLNQALQQIGSGVDTANSNFQSAEKTNTSGWGT